MKSESRTHKCLHEGAVSVPASGMAMGHRGSSFYGRGYSLFPLQGGVGKEAWTRRSSFNWVSVSKTAVKRVNVKSFCSGGKGRDPPVPLFPQWRRLHQGDAPLGAGLYQSEGWGDTGKMLPMLVYKSILGFCAPQYVCNSPIVPQS